MYICILYVHNRHIIYIFNTYLLLTPVMGMSCPGSFGKIVLICAEELKIWGFGQTFCKFERI